jgi:membrane protease YdiL (CAAX protease family)
MTVMPVMPNDANSASKDTQVVRWRRVLPFLGLTFGITYAYNLFMALTSQYGANYSTGLMLQAMMLIPACSALFLQVFIFPDGPLYFRKGFSWLRVFAYFFLVYGVAYLATGVASVLIEDQGLQMLMVGVTQFVTLGGLLFVAVLQFLAPKEERRALGLSLGSFKWYVLFTLLLIAMYGIMTALNYALNLGEVVDAKSFVRDMAQAAGREAEGVDQMPYVPFLLVMGFQTAVIAPIFALLIAFGEEYGWRGFLQSELIRMGKIKGIALVGVIWGVWHAPVILMGHNYPGYPVLGVFLMIVYCVLLSFILGMAFLKSGSVWLAAYLHGVNNQILSFLVMMVYRPNDPVFSFGVGIYGLVVMAIVVGLLLLDKQTWRT